LRRDNKADLNFAKAHDIRLFNMKKQAPKNTVLLLKFRARDEEIASIVLAWIYPGENKSIKLWRHRNLVDGPKRMCKI